MENNGSRPIEPTVALGAEVRNGRLDAAFGLIPPDAAPVEVEHDAGWIPEHLEFEGAV